MRFEGIYTPIITPFTEAGDIDTDAFAAMVEHLIASGVHGIVVKGSTGEYYAQSVEKRISLIGTAREAVAGRLPLVIGTGAIRQDDSIAIAKEARKVGAEAILVGSPPYAVPTER